jgi:hypothetical protein
VAATRVLAAVEAATAMAVVAAGTLVETVAATAEDAESPFAGGF